MLDNVESQSEQVVDARGAGRFAGSEAEPRQGLRSGHIPQSMNVPFTQASTKPFHASARLRLPSCLRLARSSDPSRVHGHASHLCYAMTQAGLSGPLQGCERDGCFQVLQEGRYKGPEELAEVFKSAGLDLERPIVASCGTGVTASVLALALHQISPSSKARRPLSQLLKPNLQSGPFNHAAGSASNG